MGLCLAVGHLAELRERGCLFFALLYSRRLLIDLITTIPLLRAVHVDKTTSHSSPIILLAGLSDSPIRLV